LANTVVLEEEKKGALDNDGGNVEQFSGMHGWPILEDSHVVCINFIRFGHATLDCTKLETILIEESLFKIDVFISRKTL
jgi:hypothetical protein